MVIRCLPAGTAARDGVPVVFRRADRIGCCGQPFRLRDLSILIPGFTLDNYREVFSERVTYSTYLITVKFCVIVWSITSVLGFFIAYFLAFQLLSRTSQTV